MCGALREYGMNLVQTLHPTRNICQYNHCPQEENYILKQKADKGRAPSHLLVRVVCELAS